MSRLSIFAALVVLLALGYFFRGPLGWAVWRSTHSASVATALNGTDPELLFSIGNYYFGEGAYDTQTAERYFQQVIRIDPMREGPHYQLARVYFINGDFASAHAQIQTELALHPDNKRSYYVRALIYGYRGELEKAEADFKEFLKWKSDGWAGWNDLAWIYFQEGKYEEARDAVRSALVRYPDNPWLLNSLGVALLNTNDQEGAKESFIKALSKLASMTEKEWGIAYPGNDPAVYREGFSKMKESVQENFELLTAVNSTSSPQ